MTKRISVSEYTTASNLTINALIKSPSHQDFYLRHTIYKRNTIRSGS